MSGLDVRDDFRTVTFFDTAEVYGPYTSEELVGERFSRSTG